MKKFVLTLAACLAFTQIHAATPALVESLLEYNAIINEIGSPQFTVIPETEFIIDIRRLKHEVNVLGTVKYGIVTRAPRHDHALVDNEALVDSEAPADDEAFAEDLSCDSHSHHHHHHTHRYIAKLLVEPNPGIGPNIVTVISIKRVHN